MSETPLTETNSSVSTSNSTATKKFRLPAAMLVGGLAVGSFFAPIDLASAQDDATETEPSQQEASGIQGRRGADHGAKGQVVEELLGLSRDELKTAFDAGKTLAEIAEEQGVAVDDLVATLVASAQERIDAAVESGKLDAEEATQKSAAISEMITEKVEAAPGEFADHGDQGDRGDGRRGGQGRQGRGLGGAEALEALGLTAEDLTAGREAGQSLAEIAAAQGVTEADLVGALVDNAEERINDAVAEGKIDADTAAGKTAGLEEQISERVNAEPGEGGQRGPGGKRGKQRPGDSADA